MGYGRLKSPREIFTDAIQGRLTGLRIRRRPQPVGATPVGSPRARVSDYALDHFPPPPEDAALSFASTPRDPCRDAIFECYAYAPPPLSADPMGYKMMSVPSNYQPPPRSLSKSPEACQRSETNDTFISSLGEEVAERRR